MYHVAVAPAKLLSFCHLIFKRNPNSFSLRPNAIVDVCLRRRLGRQEMSFFNISESVRASYFEIYHKVAIAIGSL